MVVPLCNSKKHENNPNVNEPFNNRLSQILATTNDEERVLALLTQNFNSIPTDKAIIYDIPQEFKNAIKAKNGKDLKLVIQKEVTNSDINKGLGRFLIPYLQMEDKSFLTEEEKTTLDEEIVHGTKKKRKGIDLKMIQPSLIDADLCLKMWPFSNTINYSLISNWNKIVKDNSAVIKAGALMRLFSFRVDGTLWLALIPTSHRGESSNSDKKKVASKKSSTGSVIVHIPKRHGREVCGTSNDKMKGAGTSQSLEDAPIAPVRLGKEGSGTRNDEIKGASTSQRPRIGPVIEHGNEASSASADKVKCTQRQNDVPSLAESSGNLKRNRKGIPKRAPFQ